jgi:hypothetical protein
LFISKRITSHMRWHKEGIRENDEVMVHPSNGEVWNVLDRFDTLCQRCKKYSLHVGNRWL